MFGSVRNEHVWECGFHWVLLFPNVVHGPRIQLLEAKAQLDSLDNTDVIGIDQFQTIPARLLETFRSAGFLSTN